MKNRIINFYIFREITSYFLLGILVFTMILLMGRLIKLTDLVLTRGVPFSDVLLMILYLLPSFLVFTVPMAFLLAVLLAFGRLSADNEITVMKSGGISLLQLMPPVLFCGLCATMIGLAASTAGVPYGNQAFASITRSALTSNVAATLQEKMFWDGIPGMVVYCDRYDEEQQGLAGVVIHDGRDTSRPMTIFAESGKVLGGQGGSAIILSLNRGSIHSLSKADEYRLVNFDNYAMTIAGQQNYSANAVLSELDMSVSQLYAQASDSATPAARKRKLQTELQSRFSLPFASLVFAVVAVPLGMQNRRSGKSAGFSISIGLLLCYYILLSLLRSLAEKGTLSASVGCWLPNVLFSAAGFYLLWMASHERIISLQACQLYVRSLWKGR